MRKSSASILTGLFDEKKKKRHKLILVFNALNGDLFDARLEVCQKWGRYGQFILI